VKALIIIVLQRFKILFYNKANKAFHRTPHTVALFAKTRKKSRQYAPPVNAALARQNWGKYESDNDEFNTQCNFSDFECIGNQRYNNPNPQIEIPKT
jgi:hypothetical protein